MAIDLARLLARPFPDVRQTYTARDCMLYALGLGLGADPLDEADLRHVYEQHPRFAMLPTMPVVLGNPGFWLREPDTGIAWESVVHGEQRLELHAPLPAAGTLVGRTVIEAVVDKGAGRGALVHTRRELHDDAGGLLATLRSIAFCRADGGFGGPHEAAHDAPLQPLPQRPPDARHLTRTLPQAALIYRLSGDDNPLHADPRVAARAGFERPILHGLCTYGIAGRAVVRLACGGESARLRRLDVRFTAPVLPGESIETELWLTGEREGRLRCRVVERDVVVLDRGHVAWSH